MTFLVDREVKGVVSEKKIIIKPYFDIFQGPNCYYCHLGSNFLKPRNSKRIIDPLNENSLFDIFKEFHSVKPIVLNPGEFILAETFEFIGISDEYTANFVNPSSLARIGLIQAGLGMLNAGCGYKNPVKITLELYNCFGMPIKLRPTFYINKKISWGTEILKLAFSKLSKKPKNSYNKSSDVYSKSRKVDYPKMYLKYRCLKSSENLR